MKIFLPPDWSTVGVYSIFGCDDAKKQFLVEHRFSGKRVPIPREKVPKFDDWHELYIHENWSDIRAAIASKVVEDHDHDCVLANHFPLEDGLGDVVLESNLYTSYWKFGIMSQKMRREKIVCAVDPVAFSSSNTRDGLASFGTLDAINEMLRIWECCTGLPPSFALQGNWRNLSRLQDMLCNRAQRMGRRALNISLPPDWITAGVYSILILW